MAIEAFMTMTWKLNLESRWMDGWMENLNNNTIWNGNKCQRRSNKHQQNKYAEGMHENFLTVSKYAGGYVLRAQFSCNIEMFYFP